MSSAKVQTTIFGNVIYTYIDSSGHYKLSYSGMVLPESCVLRYSKRDYSVTYCYTDVVKNGVKHVDTQTLLYVERWAVIVAVEHYQSSSLSNVSGIIKTGDDWYTFLTDTLAFEHVTYLQDANKADIVQAINDTITQVDEGDIFSLFYIAHGDFNPQNNEYYLTAHDSYIINKVGYNVLTDTELCSLLEPCVAERRFLFLDACYSAGFAQKLDDLPNKDHILLGAAAHGKAWMYERYVGGVPRIVRTCFTQCFLKEAWEEDFNSDVNAIFNNLTSTYDLLNLTLIHYQEHVDNGDRYFSSDPQEWPCFYDWYTTTSKQFYLSNKGIDDPEK